MYPGFQEFPFLCVSSCIGIDASDINFNHGDGCYLGPKLPINNKKGKDLTE